MPRKKPIQKTSCYKKQYACTKCGGIGVTSNNWRIDCKLCKGKGVTSKPKLGQKALTFKEVMFICVRNERRKEEYRKSDTNGIVQGAVYNVYLGDWVRA